MSDQLETKKEEAAKPARSLGKPELMHLMEIESVISHHGGNSSKKEPLIEVVMRVAVFGEFEILEPMEDEFEACDFTVTSERFAVTLTEGQARELVEKLNRPWTC